ncbi:MAG: hypothetical protein OXH68_07395 [Gammaproteobacteria bacterium]|nr:hypothetical protein [Gammaproteobacteria bacterium]
MTLTVGSRRIADGTIQSVGLRPGVGAYEMVFALYLSVSTGRDGLPRASVLGGRVAARPDGGEPHPLGFARPEQPFEVVCKDFVGTTSATLHLCLQANEVAALEELRAAGDLTFELSFAGTGADEYGDQYVLGQRSIRVPRSEWLQTLRGAGARDVMLLEVPLPLDPEVADGWGELVSNLRGAEEDYRNGNFRGCIAACRIVIDELGRLLDRKWPQALTRLAEGGNGRMTKAHREEAVYAAVRHYTHLAHHAPADGGETSFSRAEAEFVLSATAAGVRLARMG